MSRFAGFISGLLFFLFLRVSSWVCSVPMWATLICHFVFGLPIFWFWLTLAAWLLGGLLWYLVIVFARWGADTAEADVVKENKNPYSVGNKKD